MFNKRLGVRSVVALLIFTLVVSAFGFVAAQDNSAKPFLGVGVTSADKGVQVDQVEAGSPADKAGIKVNDVITAIDTKAVTSDTIGSVIAGHKVGDVITVTLTRGTASMDVKVTLAARPTTAAQPPSTNPSAARPVLGVQIENTTNGPTIRAVATGSPAEKAGLKVGDILTKIGDTAVKDAQSASAAVQTHKVGDDVAIEVTRDGKTVTVNVTLAAGTSTAPSAPANPPVSNRPMLGVSLEDTDNGAVVRTVVAGSPAEKAGLKVGDVLTKIGDTEVKDAQSASAAVQTHKIGDEISVEVTRDGKTVTVKATLAAAPAVSMNPMMPNGAGMGLAYDDSTKTWTIGALPQDSDLYKAGLREGDKITKFDGTAYDPAGLMAYLAKANASDVTLTVTRDGKDQEIKVPVAALMTFGMGGFGMGFGDEPFFNMPFNAGGSRLGVQFVMLDPSVAKAHNVTETVGALVTDVMPQSPAEKAGLKINDVVTAVNGDKVDGEHNLRDLLATHKPGDSIKLDVVRDGKTTQLDVTLDQMPASGMFQFPDQGGMNGLPFQMPTPEPSSPLTNGSAM